MFHSKNYKRMSIYIFAELRHYQGNTNMYKHKNMILKAFLINLMYEGDGEVLRIIPFMKL